MINAGILSAAGGAAPRGEAILTAYTSSGSWTVPAGVTSVCVVLIGAGGAATTGSNDRSAGGGGALVYKNNIAVTPGTNYSYYLQADRSSMFGLTAGAGSPAQVGDPYPSEGGVASSDGSPSGYYNGGKGEWASFLVTTQALGGSAGGYTSVGPDGGRAGNYLTGYSGGGPTYGAGGNAAYSGTPTPAEPGGIRIIWGTGRSFPYNALN